MREAGVNLVEIDLLRRGRWTVSVPEYEVPSLVAYPYRVCVLRAEDEKPAEMYATDLRQPLPTIRVPLRPDDEDVLLNLQRLLDAAWQDGGYDAIVRRPEDLPPLRQEDTAWVAGLPAPRSSSASIACHRRGFLGLQHVKRQGRLGVASACRRATPE